MTRTAIERVLSTPACKARQWSMHALANQGNSGETSQALLQDVAIRLKGQQSRLKLLKNELNQGWEAATTLLESKTIIRAVNQPLSHWKDWNQHENRSKVGTALCRN